MLFRSTTVREFVRLAFAELGIELAFSGEGVEEEGWVKACHHPDYQLLPGTVVVQIEERYFRPTEVELLIGDPAKAHRQLGWEPSYNLAALVAEMVSADLQLFKRDAYLQAGGHVTANAYE